MTNFFQQSNFIRFVVSLCANYVLVNANPLIGVEVTPARNGEFPSVVSLGRAPGNDVVHHFCTGTLITKKHVLTAAHCLAVNNVTESYMTPSGIVITVGSIQVTQGTKYQVKEWKTFREWTVEKKITVNIADSHHDVAVVTLMNDVAEDIKPAHLSNLNYKDVYGKSIVTAGWGRTNFGFKPRLLRRATLLVINKTNCDRNLKAVGCSAEYVVNHLCTIGRPPVSLGSGDSGGPLYANGDELIGVNIADCAALEHPNQQIIHASVKFYKKFIMQIVSSNCKLMENEEYKLNEFYDED